LNVRVFIIFLYKIIMRSCEGMGVLEAVEPYFIKRRKTTLHGSSYDAITSKTIKSAEDARGKYSI